MKTEGYKPGKAFKKHYYDGVYGLPNTVRETLLQTSRGELALLLDLLFNVGLRAGDTFTVRQLLDLAEGIQTSRYLIRRALHEPIFRGTPILTEKKGRPEILYTMPGIELLVSTYAEGVYGEADVLGRSAFRSLTDYRAALHREFIHRSPGQYPRAFLAQRLGVSKITTARYDKIWGIVVTANYEDSEIGFNDIETIPPKPLKKRSRWLVVQKQDMTLLFFPFVRALAVKYLFQGCKVFARQQLPNNYRWNEVYVW